ncbi:MAG: hypothetical protein QME32_00330 [Endomicrobiia bacterium]|nr:hypothetical protein [Endomicrobiia bacterium]
MSGATGYNFTAGTPARANEVNKNFEWFRGHYLPVTQSGTWANTSAVYDLGSSTQRWRAIYLEDTSTALAGNTFITKRIFSTQVGTPTSSVNITGLAGDIDKFYRLVIHHKFVGFAGPTIGVLGVTFSGFSAAAYYSNLGGLSDNYIKIASISTAATSTGFVDICIAASQAASVRMVSGQYHLAAAVIGGATTNLSIWGGWRNLTPTITSIKIEGMDGAGSLSTMMFDGGSMVELFSMG